MELLPLDKFQDFVGKSQYLAHGGDLIDIYERNKNPDLNLSISLRKNEIAIQQELIDSSTAHISSLPKSLVKTRLGK